MTEQADQLTHVSWRLLDNQEMVARRLSHELHDELGQALTALKTNLGATPAPAPTPPGSRTAAISSKNPSAAPTRSLSFSAPPSSTTSASAPPSTGSATASPSAPASTSIIPAPRRPPRAGDRDAPLPHRPGGPHQHRPPLRRDARHGHPPRVRRHHPPRDPRQWQRPAAFRRDSQGSFGLVGMRARAQSSGGALTVHTRPAQGATIEVAVPVTVLHEEKAPHPVG